MFYNPHNKFDEMYDKYADMLYRLAYSYMRNREDAEDIVHDVFIKYMKSFHVLSDEIHEQRWLVRVTINTCHDVQRKNSYRTHDALEDITEHSSLMEDMTENVFDTLSQIPEKYKTAIILHYLEGYSVEETAGIIGKSVSAVKMRLSRGREVLKNILKQENTHV